MARAFCHLQWKSTQWSKVLSELALTVISYFTANACFVVWMIFFSFDTMPFFSSFSYFWCKRTPTQKGKNEQKRNPDKTTTHLEANNKRINENLARFSKYFELCFFFFLIWEGHYKPFAIAKQWNSHFQFLKKIKLNIKYILKSYILKAEYYKVPFDFFFSLKKIF